MKDQLEPRQIEFLKNYLDPKSKTFSNAYQSAIKAGFSDEYSKTLTARDLDWLSENVGDTTMLKKAEKRLLETLEFITTNEKGVDTNLHRLVLDASKFVAERLGKQKYSARNEMTGAEGKDLIIQISKEIADKNELNPLPSNNSERPA